MNKPNHQSLTTLITLLTLECFLATSILPAWADSTSTYSPLRPSDAKDGGVGKELARELQNSATALFTITNGSPEVNTLGLDYSYLKLGRVEELDKYSTLLAERIKRDLEASPDQSSAEWTVVSVLFAVPQTNFLLSRRVAQKLNLPFLKLGRTADLDRIQSWYNLPARQYALFMTPKEREEHLRPRLRGYDFSAVKGKKIILVDDGLTTGTFLKAMKRSLKEAGATEVTAYVVARLDGLGNPAFEHFVDRRALEKEGLQALVSVLNDPRSIYTTRLITFAFGLDSGQFAELLTQLTSRAKLNLYLPAIEHFQGRSSSNLDMLVEALERDTGLPFLGSATLGKIRSAKFFLGVIEMLEEYQHQISLEAAADISRRLQDLSSAAARDGGAQDRYFLSTREAYGSPFYVRRLMLQGSSTSPDPAWLTKMIGMSRNFHMRETGITIPDRRPPQEGFTRVVTDAMLQEQAALVAARLPFIFKDGMTYRRTRAVTEEGRHTGPIHVYGTFEHHPWGSQWRGEIIFTDLSPADVEWTKTGLGKQIGQPVTPDLFEALLRQGILYEIGEILFRHLPPAMRDRFAVLVEKEGFISRIYPRKGGPYPLSSIFAGYWSLFIDPQSWLRAHDQLTPAQEAYFEEAIVSLTARHEQFGNVFFIRDPDVRPIESQAMLPGPDTDLHARDGGKRVLFVEDEKMIQESTARLLEQRGYEVVIVDNLVDAKRLLQSESFDVILTDNWFPHISGGTVTGGDKKNGEKLVRTYPDIPAILYTGGSTRDVGQRVGERKSFQVLGKPADIEVLDTVLKEVSAKDGGEKRPYTVDEIAALIETIEVERRPLTEDEITRIVSTLLWIQKHAQDRDLTVTEVIVHIRVLLRAVSPDEVRLIDRRTNELYRPTRVPRDREKLRRVATFVAKIADDYVAVDPALFRRVDRIGRYMRSRKLPHVSPSHEDFGEFKKQMESLIGAKIKELMPQHQFVEGDLDEIYTLFLGLVESRLSLDDHYSRALDVADTLTEGERKRLALLEFDTTELPEGEHTVITDVKDRATQEAMRRLMRLISQSGVSDWQENAKIQEIVFEISADRSRKFFGEKITTVSDGGIRHAAPVSHPHPSPALFAP